MPSLFAITDNGSGPAVWGPHAWACLYCCHIQSCGSCPARLNQSSIWAVESAWSSCLPLGKAVSSCIFGEPRRLPGQMHKAVLDHRGLGVHAHDLVGPRLERVTACKPCSINSWISWVPDALSSINTTSASKAAHYSHTARFNSGYSIRRRRTCNR